MKAVAIPAKFDVPWAADATASFIRSIPVAQPTPGNGQASLDLGFPPECFTPTGAGGLAPDGRDANGILNQISAWCQWLSAGGVPVTYDAAFQMTIGGYPKSAIVASAVTPGVLWLSTADDNTTNPDTGGAGWVSLLPSGGQLGSGQAYLQLSGANLQLVPKFGQYIIINGAQCAIPAGGVTLAPTGLTPSTLYYIYAFVNSGTMMLEASTTGHSTMNGVEIEAGDPTRSLVGMARVITGPAFADSDSQRFVVSWFNRANKQAQKLGNPVNFSSTTLQEITTTQRVEFLLWADEASQFVCTGQNTNDTANTGLNTLALGFDGTSIGGQVVCAVDAANLNHAFAVSGVLSGGIAGEGYHYATMNGKVGAAPQIGSIGNSLLTTMIRG